MKPETVSSAISSDNLEIPLIDFSSFIDGDEGTRKSTAQAMLDGFLGSGFIYLKNYPISKPTIQTTFKQSGDFFKRPREQKDAMSWTTPEANRVSTFSKNLSER